MRTPASRSRHLWLLSLLAAHVLTCTVACKGSDDAAEAPAAPAESAKKPEKAPKGGDKADKSTKTPGKGEDKAGKAAEPADKAGKAGKAAEPADKAGKAAAVDKAGTAAAVEAPAPKDAAGAQALGAPAARVAEATPAPKGAPRVAGADAEKPAAGTQAGSEPPALPVTDSSALAPGGGVKGLVVDPGPARAAAPGVPRGAEAVAAEPSVAVAPRGATPEDRARPVAPPADRGGSPEAGAAPSAVERLGSPERVAPALRPVEAPIPPSDRVAASPTPDRGAAQSPRLAPVRPAGAPLDISQALTANELKVISGGKAFKPGTLVGREGDPSYNSLYFAPAKGNAYGVGVQVWYEPTIRDTRTRYEDMKLTYPNVQETGNVTNYTYFAFWNDVYYLVFMGLKQRLVISVTASNETLSPNQLFAVATKVRDRLIR